MIKATGLTRYYGSFAAVRDASFAIEEREIVGFLGLNGAGKSTILKILAGLLQPTAGSVTLGGVDVSQAADAMRKRIGFLPEEPPLYREMRVDEFLTWVGRVKGRSLAEVGQRLPAVLETCHLTDVKHRVISELSHGYKKRVGIAQAIIHKPDVVILDEPISGLDPKQIVEMREVVRSLTRDATVLISSHILTEIALTCDRVLVIHRGEIVAEGSEQELGKTLGESQRVSLTLVGDEERVKAVLEGHEAVAEFTPSLEVEDDDAFGFDVVLDGSVEGLVKTLVEADVGVRGARETVSELERVFLELTRDLSTRREPQRRAS